MWRTYLYNFLLLTLMGSLTLALQEDVVGTCLKNGLEEYLKTGQQSANLTFAIENLQLPHLFRGEGKSLVSKAACLACKVSIGVVIAARRHGAEKETITDILEKLCVWLKIEPEEVCHGSISMHADSLAYIVDNKKDLTADRICNILHQKHGCKDPNRKDWTIQLPKGNRLSSDFRQTKNTSKPIKILQLSDIHYDPNYEAGSNAVCETGLCCQKGSKPAHPEHAAGYWSDYRYCDTPWHMFTDSIDHIVAKHKDIDSIYFTGDIINHKVWDTSTIENVKAIKDVLQKLRDSFGTTPLYPILGNHEPHPVNLFSTEGVHEPKLSTQWILDLSADEWKHWLPSNTRETILKGGYYTVLVKPGFRIIGLNSNVCYTSNWWLFYDDVDQFDQLQWLVQVLSEAEKNGEKVHILSHIQSGQGECLYNWNREFTKIIDRFAHIVAAQFNGHTHFDEALIFFNHSNSAQAVNVAFNGGSLTSWIDLNPNYKIYTVNPENMEVLDYEIWTFNTTEANLSPSHSPNWYKLYSFKQAFGVESLKPQELAKFAERMAKTPELTELYFRFKSRGADSALAMGCNDKCHINNLCNLVTSHAEHTLHCDIITDIYNSRERD